MPFITSTLPSTFKKLGTIFGLNNSMNCQHRIVFPSTNAASAYIANGLTPSSTVLTVAKAGSASALTAANLGDTLIKGTTSDEVTLEYYPNGTGA